VNHDVADIAHTPDTSDPFSLRGRSAFLTTGATQGIGYAIALGSRMARADVDVHGRAMAAADRAARELRATPWACDLADGDASYLE
jgi:NAD(P)-dependent dehydrogenase (short-subunit alcohol dehydrogenase family)